MIRLYNEPDFDQFVAAPEGGLQSNWPSDYFEPWVPKDRKPREYFELCAGNIPICRAKTQDLIDIAKQKMREFYPKTPLLVNFVSLTEEDYRKQDEARRELLWLEQIYKPTPARTMHHR